MSLHAKQQSQQHQALRSPDEDVLWGAGAEWVWLTDTWQVFDMVVLPGSMQEVWHEVLRCVSRWELLQQVHSGGPTDALLFAQPGEVPGSAKRKPLSFFSLRAAPSPAKHEVGEGPDLPPDPPGNNDSDVSR